MIVFSPIETFGPMMLLVIVQFSAMLTGGIIIAFSNEGTSTPWLITESIIDFTFLIDIVINFFTAYYNSEYFLIDDKKVWHNLITGLVNVLYR